MPDPDAASFGSLWSCSKGSQGHGTVSHGHSCVLKWKKERKNRPSSGHIAQKDPPPRMRLGNHSAQGYKSIPKHPDVLLFAHGVLISLMIYTANAMS